MGIWIRSQNHIVLCEANNIWVDGERIYAEFGGSRMALLGVYPTEAEAIRVLDMIEGVIGSQVVFQMPEAGFSGAYVSALGQHFLGGASSEGD